MNNNKQIVKILNLPSTNSFRFFIDKKPIIGTAATVYKNIPVTLSIQMEISGLEEIPRYEFNASAPSFINFCIYETNFSTGIGSKVIRFFSAPLSLNRSNAESINYDFDLLFFDESIQPMKGGFEGSPLTPLYDLKNAFLSLIVFYSIEDYQDKTDLNDMFDNFNNIILNTKIPVKQSESHGE